MVVAHACADADASDRESRQQVMNRPYWVCASAKFSWKGWNPPSSCRPMTTVCKSPVKITWCFSCCQKSSAWTLNITWIFSSAPVTIEPSWCSYAGSEGKRNQTWLHLIRSHRIKQYSAWFSWLFVVLRSLPQPYLQKSHAVRPYSMPNPGWIAAPVPDLHLHLAWFSMSLTVVKPKACATHFSSKAGSAEWIVRLDWGTGIRSTEGGHSVWRQQKESAKHFRSNEHELMSENDAWSVRCKCVQAPLAFLSCWLPGPWLLVCYIKSRIQLEIAD